MILYKNKYALIRNSRHFLTFKLATSNVNEKYEGKK